MTNPEANSGLYDRVYEIGNLYSAWVRVEESDGCAGIDGVTLERFAEDLDGELERLSRELAEGSYHPLPANTVVQHPRAGVNTTWRGCIDIQAGHYAQLMRGEAQAYLPIEIR